MMRTNDLTDPASWRAWVRKPPLSSHFISNYRLAKTGSGQTCTEMLKKGGGFSSGWSRLHQVLRLAIRSQARHGGRAYLHRDEPARRQLRENRREETGEKTVFLSHLCIKMLILPRQARDKHGESTKKRTVFFAGLPGANTNERQAEERKARFRLRV